MNFQAFFLTSISKTVKSDIFKKTHYRFFFGVWWCQKISSLSFMFLYWNANNTLKEKSILLLITFAFYLRRTNETYKQVYKCKCLCANDFIWQSSHVSKWSYSLVFPICLPTVFSSYYLTINLESIKNLCDIPFFSFVFLLKLFIIVEEYLRRNCF